MADQNQTEPSPMLAVGRAAAAPTIELTAAEVTERPAADEFLDTRNTIGADRYCAVGHAAVRARRRSRG